MNFMRETLVILVYLFYFCSNIDLRTCERREIQDGKKTKRGKIRKYQYFSSLVYDFLHLIYQRIGSLKMNKILEFP